MDNLVKVYFMIKEEEDEFESEGIWCIKRDNVYIVDNIPFVAKRLALGDTITAEFDREDKLYYFDDFIAVSGNSTIRLYFEDADLIAPTRNYLNGLGCESEVLDTRNLLTVNVPKEVDYAPIKEFLERGEKEGKWVYEEPCLSHSDP